MFGIIYALGTLIFGGASAIKNAADNEYYKNQWREKQSIGDNPVNIYYDYKGRMRDLSTGNFTSTERCAITGDLWKLQMINRNPPVRTNNLSEEWRRAYYESQKANPSPGKTVVNDIMVYQYSSPNCVDIKNLHKMQWKNTFYCRGQWYKDLQTGNLYVKRRKGNISINGFLYKFEFYMNIMTRKLIRLTDDFNNKYHEVIDNPDLIAESSRIIDEWNREINNEHYDNATKATWGETEWTNYFRTRYGDCYNGDMSQQELNMMGVVKPMFKRY